MVPTSTSPNATFSQAPPGWRPSSYCRLLLLTRNWATFNALEGLKRSILRSDARLVPAAIAFRSSRRPVRFSPPSGADLFLQLELESRPAERDAARSVVSHRHPAPGRKGGFHRSLRGSNLQRSYLRLLRRCRPRNLRSKCRSSQACFSTLRMPGMGARPQRA